MSEEKSGVAPATVKPDPAMGHEVIDPIKVERKTHPGVNGNPRDPRRPVKENGSHLFYGRFSD